MPLHELLGQAPQKSQQSERPSDKPTGRATNKPRAAHRRIRLHSHSLSTGDPHATRFALLPLSQS
jgi:hypothetical protein